jgi:hypothetical protein
VPVLARVGEADRLAVLLDVGEDHHLRVRRVLILARDIDLELAEAAREVLQRCGFELLPRNADHAMTPERAEDHAEVARIQRLRQVGAEHLRAEHFSRGNDLDHLGTPSSTRHCRAAAKPRDPAIHLCGKILSDGWPGQARP